MNKKDIVQYQMTSKSGKYALLQTGADGLFIEGPRSIEDTEQRCITLRYPKTILFRVTHAIERAYEDIFGLVQ